MSIVAVDGDKDDACRFGLHEMLAPDIGEHLSDVLAGERRAVDEIGGTMTRDAGRQSFVGQRHQTVVPPPSDRSDRSDPARDRPP